jgi:hypothetical protein
MPDTFGVLFNQGYGVIATDDNTGGGGQFLMERSLPAGTYYLQIGGSTGSVMGNYRLFMEIVP